MWKLNFGDEGICSTSGVLHPPKREKKNRNDRNISNNNDYDYDDDNNNKVFFLISILNYL